MIIKKLELQGFKSFPDKTRIVFHTGITCIIGPNGTGKSNIVDALIWVMGGKRHRIAKSEKRGDIIFNGNTEKAPQSLADVTLSLSEDSEELKISHRIFRSGESEYRMDGKLVRLKDIQDTLWKKAISESDYFVIEQGAIGLFLALKPVEKRSLLEEAAGTAYYKDKKRQAQNKLENSEQNLIRLEDIISEVSRAKNSLKRQASAAIRYRKLREDIHRLNSHHFRKRIEDMEIRQENILKNYHTSSDNEKSARLKFKDREKDLSDLRKQTWDLEKINKSVQESLYTAKSQLSKLEAEKEREEKRADYIKEKKTDTQSNIAELQKELKGLEAESADAQSSLKSLSKNIQKKQETYDEARKKSQDSQDRLDQTQKDLNSLRRDYLQRISGHTEMRNESARLEKESEIISQQEKKLASQLDRERSRLEELEKRNARIKIQVAELKKKQEENDAEIDTKSRELERIRRSLSKNQEEIAEKNSSKDKLSHHLSVLEELAEKEHGPDHPEEPPGSWGLLADFVGSDPESAPLIDIIWKDEVKASLVQAQDFLDKLVGKAVERDLLLLHPHPKPPASPKVFEDPRVIGRLTSRLKVKDKLKKYLSQLGEAAIVKDIKTAADLWIQHPAADFITLEGDVLFSSGYLKYRKGEEGFFALKQEMESVRKKIADAEENIVPLQKKIKSLKESEQSLETSICELQDNNEDLNRKLAEEEKDAHRDSSEMKMLRTNIEIIQKELDIYRTDKETLSQKKAALQADLDRNLQQEKSLKEKIASKEKVLADLRQKNSLLQKDAYDLRSEIDVFEEKLNNLEQRINGLNQREKTITDKIASLEKDIQTSDTDAAKCSQGIQAISQKIKALTQEIKEQEVTLLGQETELKTLTTALSEKENKLDILREELESKKDKRVDWEVKKAEMERDRVNLEEACWQEIKKSIEEVKKEIPLEDIKEEDVSGALAEKNEKLQKFTSVNLMAEEEYISQKKRYDFLLQEKEDLRHSIDSTRQAIRKIDKESRTQFLDALHQVNKNFQEVFSLLFDGGNAELKLSEPENPLESGIDITAQPPGKRVQNLNMLSGGEKTLTSLAFFFALFRYKPTPFCILDEVDAALDEVNLGRFLGLMKKIKDQTQFILITHNFKTMEVADYIYGTTMAEPNITSLYSVKMDSTGKTALPDMESKPGNE